MCDTLRIYIMVLSAVTFLVYGLDKLYAIRHDWRISEKALLLWAAAGGSPGALLAMVIFRHKIRDRKFTVGVPLIFLAQILAAAFVISVRKKEGLPV